MNGKQINTEKISLKRVIKTIAAMLIIAIITYVIMAIITHFSLNYLTENYKFYQSIVSVFDTDTAIFKFFIGFVVLCVSTVVIAISIQKYSSIFSKKDTFG